MKKKKFIGAEPQIKIIQHRELHPNGKYHRLYYSQNGIKVGEYKEWYDNGQLYIKVAYKNGLREGNYQVWDRNGILTEQYEYKSGETAIKHSHWDIYQESPIIIIKNGIPFTSELSPIRSQKAYQEHIIQGTGLRRGQVTTYPRKDLKSFKALAARNLQKQPTEKTVVRTKKRSKEKPPEKLDEIFYNPDLIQPCINLLRDVDPPLIGIDNNCIRKNVSAFCIWIRKMKGFKIVKPYNDETYTRLLNDKFTDLDMYKDGSSFRKHAPRAEKKYGELFNDYLSELSQNSQIKK